MKSLDTRAPTAPKRWQLRRAAAFGTCFVLSLAVLGVGCQAHEPQGVRSVATRQLRCEPEDVYAVVNRTTPKVREWIVGCDFHYTRVLCSGEGCAPAGPKPPCFGDLECFDEDPVTLQWTVPRTALKSGQSRDGDIP